MSEILLPDLTLGDIGSGKYKAFFPNCTTGLQTDNARQSYDEYFNLIYSTLDRIKDRIEMHPIHREHDTEDRITVEIANAFRFLNIPADHDSCYGGNCDIVINELNDQYLWLAEAKIDYDNTHIMEGFRQLVDRYATASNNQKDGALLIYCKDSPKFEVLDSWKKYLRNKDQKSQEYSVNLVYECDDYFITKHNHKSKGKVFNVRHIPISLFDPSSDKSARAKKRCSHLCDKCCSAVRPKRK